MGLGATLGPNGWEVPSTRAPLVSSGSDDMRILGQHFGHQAVVTGGTAMSSVTLWTAPYDVSSLLLYFAAPNVSTQKFRCSIEVPDGATPISASVNGALEWTVDTNGPGVTAEVNLAIRAGTTVRVHTKVEVVGAGDLRVSEALLLAGESCTSYSDTADYTRTAGQIPGGAVGRTDGPANVLTVRPTWIAARRPRAKLLPTVMGSGDSIQRGDGIPQVVSGEAVTRRNGTWFVQGLRRVGLPDWINYSVASERISSLFDGLNGGAATWSWRGKNATWARADIVISNLSTNDLGDRTALETCTRLHDFAKLLYSLGRELVLCTNVPRTAVTGNHWQTASQAVQLIERRTFLNSWIRNGFQMQGNTPVLSGGTPSPYVRRFFDGAAAIEVNDGNVLTANGGKWLVPAAPLFQDMTIQSVAGDITRDDGSRFVITVAGTPFQAWGAAGHGLNSMVAVFRTGAAAGQSACIAATNAANTVPLYSNGGASPTGIAGGLPGLTVAPQAGDKFDVFEVMVNDGVHPTLKGHTVIADAFEIWLRTNGLAA